MKRNMEEQVIYLTKPVVTSEGNRVITLAGVVTNDKIFSIGMSLSSPSDKYNQEIGNKIAYGRALSHKRVYAAISFSKGLFSKAVVKAILETKIHFISENLKLFVKSNSVNV